MGEPLAVLCQHCGGSGWVRRPPDGPELRQRRLNRGMTQAEVARAVGVGVPHISKVERGHERPSPDLVARILHALARPEEGP